MAAVHEKLDDLLPDQAAVIELVKSIPVENPSADDSKETGHTPDHDPGSPRQSARDGFDGIPAKPAVYACFSAQGDPIAVATTANLRNALRNRIFNETSANKRINYADIAQSIRFRRVGSAFAASWWYYRTVRALFPGRYAAMLAWKQAWFVTLNPEADFPRLQLSNTLAEAPAINIGPLLTRRKARGIVDSIEDLFDLCRYYDILRQAPHGTPCAYKELGKCPAPCDGSMPIAEYKQQIIAALEYVSNSSDAQMRWFENQERLMRQAATRMDFRLAATHKRKLNQANTFNQEKFTHVHLMDDWKYLIIQRGKTAHWIAPFVAGPGWIVSLPEVQDVAGGASVPLWMAACQAVPTNCTVADGFPVEEIAALVTYHKYRPGEAGLYIHINRHINSEIINKALQFWLNYRGDYDMPEMNSPVPSASLFGDDQSDP